MYIVHQIFYNSCFFNILGKRDPNEKRSEFITQPDIFLKLIHYYTSISTEQISIIIDMIQQKVRLIKRSW